MYTFDDIAGDVNLAHFDENVTYDQTLSLPLIHDALAARPELLLYGSPWSPPAWMKDSNEMCCGGALLDEYRSTWANYISKWVTAYEAQGVPIWAITVQNEPEAAQSWESCLYTAEETRDFVAGHLGPILKKDHPDVKILGFDHNKDHIVEWADELMSSNSSSSLYVDGIAFHWYSGSCFENVQTVSERYPDKILLPSEACFELSVLEDDAGEESWLADGTWSKGEGYGYDILGDLESGASGWTDWNILLNSEGGPNHVGNFCDAAMIAEVGVPEEDMAVYYHPQYFYLGHFSKFISPGSRRVQTDISGEAVQSDCSWPYGGCDADRLHVTSWMLADQSAVAVVALNCGSDEKEMALTMTGKAGSLKNSLPANSIQTYLIPL